MKREQTIKLKISLLLFLLIGILIVLYPIRNFASVLISVDDATLALSSQATNYEPANAVVGNPSSHWGIAYSDDQWIYIDLGATAPIAKVVLDWETTYGADYSISNDSPSSSRLTPVKSVK